MQETALPATTYEAQIWVLTRNQKGKLRVVQRNMEGKIAGIRWEQKKW